MLYVDRIEEELVVCQDEDEHMKVIDLALFDTPVREGDCVVSSGGERFRVDEAATLERRKAMSKRYRSLFSRRKK